MFELGIRFWLVDFVCMHVYIWLARKSSYANRIKIITHTDTGRFPLGEKFRAVRFAFSSGTRSSDAYLKRAEILSTRKSRINFYSWADREEILTNNWWEFHSFGFAVCNHDDLKAQRSAGSPQPSTSDTIPRQLMLYSIRDSLWVAQARYWGIWRGNVHRRNKKFPCL